MINYLLLLLCLTFRLFADSPSVGEISTWVLNTKQAVVQKEKQNGLEEKDLFFMTVWNFDNTILDGDSTEGNTDIYGKMVFKGLAQLSIEAGFSKKYSSFQKFWTDYTALENADEPKAYAYAAQILAGEKESKVLQFTTQYFEKSLKNYLFPASMELIREFQKEKISIQIISASPRIFVQGAARLLNVPLEDIYGMETVVTDGLLTDQMVLPLTTREGKIKKIEQIVQKKLQQYKKVYVLAGFGNYNFNDMVFVKWIANQQFSVGKPLAVVDYHPPRILQQNFLLLPLVLGK